ncbi:MAG: FtsB family cell division protein [Minisyncoccota bacterium]
MRELEKRQKMRRRMYSTPVIIGLLVVTIFLVKGAYSLLLTERRSAEKAEILALKVSSLALREEFLKSEIARLNTEAGIEEEIKSKYNVARPGELVALIVDDTERASTTEEEASWWKRFWDAIIVR